MTLRTLLTSRARIAWLAGAVVIAVVVALVLAPRPIRLDDRTTGNTALVQQVRKATTGKERVGLSVAVLEMGELRQAGLGDTGGGAPVLPRTPFEIGSVTKTLTASMFADMVHDGVVRPNEKVRDVLPDRHWKKGGVGDATLAQLASHRSGLPRNPLTLKTYLGSFGYTFFGANPDAHTSPADVIDAAAGSGIYAKGRSAYSNLGFAFLGHVLAEKAGKPYPELLRQRVLDPLHMDATAVPPADGNPPRGAARGHDGSGRQVAPGLSAGYAPAGSGVWSTTADLAGFADQVMRGKAPGSNASEPRYPTEGGRIGYAWITSPKSGGGSIVWHNGSAGGCTSFVGFDRATGRVVVVLNDTDVNVDAIGVKLLTGAGKADSGAPANPVAVAVGMIAPPLGGLSLLGVTLGGFRRKKRHVSDRAGILGNAGGCLFLFALAYAGGALGYTTVGGWLVGSTLVGVAAFIAAVRWRELPWNGARRRWLHWAGSAIWVVIGVAVAVGVAG